MNCTEMNSMLPDLIVEESLVGSGASSAEVDAHLAECSDCSRELAELRATMALLDQWEAPAPNPYFLTRLNARLNEERQAQPAGWFENLRARLLYGSRHTLRPVAAMAMTVVVLLGGGGAYLGVNHWEQAQVQPTQTAAVVNDLQTMDNNAQLLDQLESLSGQDSN